MLAQAFDVGDQVGGGVGDKAAPGQAASGAALVEKHRLEAVGVEQGAVAGVKAAAGAAMQEQGGNAVGAALRFDPQAVTVADVEMKAGAGRGLVRRHVVSASSDPPEKLR